MNESAIIAQLNKIERQNERILRMLTAQPKPVKKWVKASDVLKLTGRDRQWLRRARASGLIDFKRDGGFFYDVSSIPAQFIRTVLNTPA